MLASVTALDRIIGNEKSDQPANLRHVESSQLQRRIGLNTKGQKEIGDLKYATSHLLVLGKSEHYAFGQKPKHFEKRLSRP